MGVPTHDEVMRESSDGQGESELEGLPSRTCLSVYPKTRICLFYYFMTFTNSLTLTGGYPRPPFSEGNQLRALVN